MFKIIKKNDVSLLAVSVVFLIYIFNIVVPFANTYGFFSEGFPPQEDKVFLYFLMTTPVLLSYIAYVFFTYKKVNFLKCLIYPVILLDFYIGLFISLMVLGGAVLWLAVFLLPIFFVILLVSLVIGIIRDIKYFKLVKGRKRPLS